MSIIIKFIQGNRYLPLLEQQWEVYTNHSWDFNGMIVKNLSVLRGRNALLFFEQSAEIHWVFVTDNSRYLVHVIICCLQQTDRIVDAGRQYIVHGRHSRYLLEVAEEPTYTHTVGYCKFFNVDIFIVMLAEISASIFHFLLKIGACSRLLLQARALNKQKDLTQIHRQQFLKANPAGLKLVDHFLKKVSIGRGYTTVKHIIIQRYVIVAQNILHVTSGEVDPIYFRLIIFIVDIVLRLPRKVKHHVASGNLPVFAVKEEMCFTGGDVQQLIVQSPPRALCGQAVLRL